jgi:hypothetical protein
MASRSASRTVIKRMAVPVGTSASGSGTLAWAATGSGWAASSSAGCFSAVEARRP